MHSLHLRGTVEFGVLRWERVCAGVRGPIYSKMHFNLCLKCAIVAVARWEQNYDAIFRFFGKRWTEVNSAYAFLWILRFKIGHNACCYLAALLSLILFLFLFPFTGSLAKLEFLEAEKGQKGNLLTLRNLDHGWSIRIFGNWRISNESCFKMSLRLFAYS